jgi:hypothetical protein
MARSISFQDALIANEVVTQNVDVNNSEFNPLGQTSRVSVFAAATVAGTAGRGVMLTVKLATDVHCSDFIVPVAAAVSTRDHLVSTGAGGRGSKITIGYRNEGTATPTLNCYVVIEPL